MAFAAHSQVNPTPTSNSKNKQILTNNTSIAPVKDFFTAFGKGDINGIINSFSEDCTIYAVRDQVRKEKEIYGTYHGRDGVKAFISNLGEAFDTKAFALDNLLGEGNIVFANGTFTHIIKTTDRPFTSGWALKCEIRDGKILSYHFYEDSTKYLAAAQP